MFEPLNKGHAISEVVFFLEFENLSTSVMDVILPAHARLADILPRNDPTPGMVFQQSAGGFEMNQVFGAEWKHFLPNGSMDWVARVTPHSISVHCLDYSNWREVWPKAYRILSELFRDTSSFTLPTTNIGLRYIDRFDFKGAVSAYDARELIRENSAHVAGRVLTSGTRWHNYTGWYENSEVLQRDILQQLNIDAVEMMDTKLPVVSITHASLLRASGPGQLDGFRHFVDMENSPLAVFMDVAHKNNHTVLREVLTDHMLARIGLRA